MKLHPVVLGAFALLVTAVCLAAGSWQLSRMGAKRALNAARQAVLSAPAQPLAETAGGLARQAGRKVAAEGVFDGSRHVLLSARFRRGDLGVEVLTPLFTTASGALLVNRGWMRAGDGQSAHPESLAGTGALRVTGVLEPLPSREGMPPWRSLEGRGAERWSTHELDAASVAAHAPYPLAPYVLVALPEAGAPPVPERIGPPAYDEGVHLSYAIQWFAFAAATVVGTVTLALRGRANRRAGPGRRA